MFIADVSGHGTPAAVLMAITHAIAHSQPGTHTPPAALLHYLNQRLTRSYTHDATFVTAFYAVLDPAARTLTYSVAGYNPPRLLHNGRVTSLDANGGLPLGIDESVDYTASTAQLTPGEVLLLYTDGITEAMTPPQGSQPRELFGVHRLDSILLEFGATSLADLLRRIRAAVAAFSHDVVADEQTLIAVQCFG